jgi:hypothetical protein
MDRAVHARDGEHHRFAVVCPETGPEGVRIFVDRLAVSVAGLLRDRGVPLDPGYELARATYTYPGDEDRLAALREQFAAIDRAQHPEHPVEAKSRAARSAPPPS